MATQADAVIKGRVGNFEYGYIGKRQWIVRDRRTAAIVATAEHLSGASRAATRAYDLEKLNLRGVTP